MRAIDDILRLATKENASDIHLQAGLPPVLRIQTRLVRLESETLSAEATEQLIFSIMSEQQKRIFHERLEFDFSYDIPSVARFRVNVFRQRDTLAAAFRRFPHEIPTPDALGLPSAVVELSELKRGFVLFTGAAGQGKSTSLASLIDRINRDRQVHIVTLEDPIEYVFEHRSSVVVQRELGNDMLDFAAALRAALREDPDVILVGEMRDFQTVEAALTAAETGHLVFATLHTQNAAQSIDRIVDVFPPHQQQQTRIQLSNVLHAVVTQQLVLRRDNGGLSLALEYLRVNAAIRNLIRDAKTFQIQSVLQTGVAAGMITMESSLKSLVDRGVLTEDDALEHAFDGREMARLLGRQRR
ncbi:MAG TPA: type IV pilus twitching motility protein PilT [Candidatus Methylomirabilis sp.]|nr:type IV pilus twitching motility protein PilT [Candidatus Methylomirabilis sp.]